MASLGRERLNFDGITELTEGIFDRINKINRIRAEGRQGEFDRRNMRPDEGELFRLVPKGYLQNSSRPRLGCKSLSHPTTHGRVYLRKLLRAVGGGEKVDFFSRSQ